MLGYDGITKKDKPITVFGKDILYRNPHTPKGILIDKVDECIKKIKKCTSNCPLSYICINDIASMITLKDSQYKQLLELDEKMNFPFTETLVKSPSTPTTVLKDIESHINREVNKSTRPDGDSVEDCFSLMIKTRIATDRIITDKTIKRNITQSEFDAFCDLMNDYVKVSRGLKAFKKDCHADIYKKLHKNRDFEKNITNILSGADKEFNETQRKAVQFFLSEFNESRDKDEFYTQLDTMFLKLYKQCVVDGWIGFYKNADKYYEKYTELKNKIKDKEKQKLNVSKEERGR